MSKPDLGRGKIFADTLGQIMIPVYLEFMLERYLVTGWDFDLKAYDVIKVHEFDPGGREHWAMPRCAYPQCREMRDHPAHSIDNNVKTIPVTVGFDTTRVVGRLTYDKKLISDAQLVEMSASWFARTGDGDVLGMSLIPHMHSKEL